MPEPATESDPTATPADGAPHEDPGVGDEDAEMEYVERVWREVRGRLEDRLGRTELAAALGAYAADHQHRLRMADVRRIRAEYGTSREPNAEVLFPLLLSRKDSRGDSVA